MDINSSEVPLDQDTGSSTEKRVLKEDILIVQALIEGYMHYYKSKSEVVRTLQDRHRIDPLFTTLVWEKLEKENSEVIKPYSIRVRYIEETNKLRSADKKLHEMTENPANPISQIVPTRAQELQGPLTIRFGPRPLDGAYDPEASSSAGLELPSGVHPRENVKHLAHSPRAFRFTNLVSDSTNLEDLGPLGNYSGSPFLPNTPPGS